MVGNPDMLSHPRGLELDEDGPARDLIQKARDDSSVQDIAVSLIMGRGFPEGDNLIPVFEEFHLQPQGIRGGAAKAVIVGNL